MWIAKYIPEKMYGFVLTPNSEIFFHLRVFRPLGGWIQTLRCDHCSNDCDWITSQPPPILGELVDVELDTTSTMPRAKLVTRKVAPVMVRGEVEIFDPTRGYGFIHGEDGRTYHLHRSEVVDGKIPLPGQTILFYAGVRQGKPRACHVKVC